jgi:Cdc6-like AAA superfamily ATPase
MDTASQTTLLTKASQVFRPGAPIDTLSLFAGRLDQVTKVINAINQPGQHVVLYGERGVGKTSLARVLSQMLENVGQHFVHAAINCDRGDDFSSIWHKAFRRIWVDVEQRKSGFRNDSYTSPMALDSLLSEAVKPDDIRHVLNYIQVPTIIIIDETDTVQDRQATSLLADTIKNLSDHISNTTLILVGVADSIDDLIAEHRSIERALIQVLMPRMSKAELFEILEKGCSELGMTMDEDAQHIVAQLSQGLPHYVHSLGLYSTQRAIQLKRTHVDRADVNIAIEETVTAAQSHLSAYEKAIRCQQKTIFTVKSYLLALLPLKVNWGTLLPLM